MCVCVRVCVCVCVVCVCMCMKGGGRGAWAVCRFKGKGGFTKKEEGGAFEGRLITHSTLCKDSYRLYILLRIKKNQIYLYF